MKMLLILLVFLMCLSLGVQLQEEAHKPIALCFSENRSLTLTSNVSGSCSACSYWHGSSSPCGNCGWYERIFLIVHLYSFVWLFVILTFISRFFFCVCVGIVP